MTSPAADVDSLTKSIIEKGEKIRALKAQKPPTLKEDLAPLVSELIQLKSSYKKLTGEEYGAPPVSGNAGSSDKDKSGEPGKKLVAMEDLVALCKARGFVFQSSEIYNSMPGFFDFGPLGVELKNNIKKLWWQEMVQRREVVAPKFPASIAQHISHSSSF
jgi:hypothetical protein